MHFIDSRCTLLTADARNASQVGIAAEYHWDTLEHDMDTEDIRTHTKPRETYPKLHESHRRKP
jgi:hypothetical protein